MSNTDTSLEVHFRMVSLYNSLFGVALSLVCFTLPPALLSKSVRRRAPWIAQLSTWIVFSAVYLLLVGQQLGPEPNQGICTFQAALIYSVGPLCAVSTTCNVIDLYNILQSLFHDTSKERMTRYWTPILLISPWIVFLAVMAEIVIVVVSQGSSVAERAPNGFFCHINTAGPTITSAAIVFLTALIMFYIQIRIAMLLKIHWTQIERPQNFGLYLSMFIRTSVLSLLTFIAVGLGILAFFKEADSLDAWSLCFPMMPMLVALLFGSQKDIMTVWLSWFRQLFHILLLHKFVLQGKL